MKYLRVKILLFVFLSLLISCFQVYDTNFEKSTEASVFIKGEEVDDKGKSVLEYKDKIFEIEDEKIILHTSNKKYWSVRGYTLWKFFPDEREVNEVEIRKLSGDESAGYGFICCRNKCGEEDRFLCILIYTAGRYSIGYVVNGRYKSIVYRNENKNLVKGSGANNIIRVEVEGKRISIYFTKRSSKEKADYVIENSEEYNLGNKGSGVVAVISPKDNFPKTDIHIEYTK